MCVFSIVVVAVSCWLIHFVGLFGNISCMIRNNVLEKVVTSIYFCLTVSCYFFGCALTHTQFVFFFFILHIELLLFRSNSPHSMCVCFVSVLSSKYTLSPNIKPNHTKSTNKWQQTKRKIYAFIYCVQFEHNLFDFITFLYNIVCHLLCQPSKKAIYHFGMAAVHLFQFHVQHFSFLFLFFFSHLMRNRNVFIKISDYRFALLIFFSSSLLLLLVCVFICICVVLVHSFI